MKKETLKKSPDPATMISATRYTLFASRGRQGQRHFYFQTTGAAMDKLFKNIENILASDKTLKDRFIIPAINLPEIKLPRRSKDCPAAPICESVGNLRRACQEGSTAFNGPGADACIAGVLLLISRLAGMWPQQMVEEVEEKRKIGFGIGDQQGDKQP
jgi:hypothetical protein